MNDTMLQAQGLPPVEPYRTLQVHPSASREQIVDAYWTLVARYKRSLTHPAEGSAGVEMGELNRAYATLIDDERRRAFDEESGYVAARPPRIDVRRRTVGVLGFGSSIVATSDHIDYYHLLLIDRDADDEMIDVAYTVLARKAIGYNIEDVFLRSLLDEAHHTLRDPELRAQYDASLTKNGKQEPRGNGSAPALTVVPATAAADAVPPPPSNGGGSGAAVPVAAAAIAVTTNGDGPAEKPKRGFLRRQKKAPVAGAAAVAAATGAAIAADSEDVNAAEHARLLALRDVEHAEVPEPAVHPDYGAERALAELEFVAGPRAGTRLSLGAEAVTLGSSYEADVMLGTDEGIAPEHGRIWQHGDNFVFRQVDGAGTLIGGQELTLPVVMLDEGDEIVIGPHHMRFHHLP